MKIAIIGSEGYIGTRLFNHLESKHEIIGFDTNWFGRYNPHSVVIDYANLNVNSDFDAVVLLAGHSSVKMCVGNWDSAYNNNVRNFVNIVKQLRNTNTKFIFASSSSVYGNTHGELADEEYPNKISINEYDITKSIVDKCILMEKDVEWYGLRFGTVNGFSKNFRSELMINSMTTASMINGEISINNPEIYRGILGMTDLCGAIERIIDDGTVDKSGFYNLCSFNASVKEIADTVVDCTNSTIKYNKDLINPYNFRISNSKFESTFNFKFQQQIKDIVEEITINRPNIRIFGNRDGAKVYV